MLTVYSAHGSPGASTTAMYLAAQWASTGTEVLLIEADPAGGSLSHHLGIQFTPGSASFVASGLPVTGGNLIDHSQDVLFNNLHVMPSTSSPTGAREIVKWLAVRAGELRAIAETEMAIIIDGGRITADTAAAELTKCAAGVVVVARGDTSPTGLEHIGTLLSAETSGAEVERCVVTVGDSPMTEEEWREKCDITFCGAVMVSADVTGDLTAFLNRNKRKSKKWRISLEGIAEKLLPLAKPPVSGGARARHSEPEVEQPPAAGESATMTAASAPDAVDSPAPPAQPAPGAVAHDEAGSAGRYVQATHPQPDPYYGTHVGAYGEVAPPMAADPRYTAAPESPYAVPPHHPGYQHYPPEPGYYEPPPAPPEQAYIDSPIPVYQPPYAPQASPYEVPPAPGAPYEHQAAPPPGARHAPAPSHEAPQPYPPQPHRQPHEAPGHPQQPPAAPPAPQHPYQQPLDASPAQPVAHQPQAHHQPAADHQAPPAEVGEHEPLPDLAASGSFRDWAARMHGEAPQGSSTSGHGGAS